MCYKRGVEVDETKRIIMVFAIVFTVSVLTSSITGVILFLLKDYIGILFIDDE